MAIAKNIIFNEKHCTGKHKAPPRCVLWQYNAAVIWKTISKCRYHFTGRYVTVGQNRMQIRAKGKGVPR